ncbi:uncharacterized protein LOC132198581 [Neocloeon triangulifer]|uniref:uncharacterized protein LOC132198581 n=1 Tax=Neocloeon triangulifer TaxID=2078957 RepID=UPI00286F6F29|nr:uncharacterized protein LOC132198581 [Neocloeon triangulifer]
MMRELDTVSPVVWPAWCYSGEGGTEGEATTETPKSRKRRAQQAAAPLSGDMAEMKTERVSPAPSPSGANLPALKHMEQMMNRNYSDFMRSLAAKYNNSNPNDYFSCSRNGYLKSGPFPEAATSAPEVPTPKVSKPGEPSPILLGHPALGFPGMMDMSSTQALLSMVRSANLEQYFKGKQGPLDLSAAAPHLAKKVRSELKSVSPKPPPRSASSGSANSGPAAPAGHTCPSLCTDRPCEGQGVSHWGVEDVCNFVGSIDICEEYTEVFREQSIDGSALPLLTEEHLTNSLGLKLGPALKLRATLARRLGHCASCLHCVHCHGRAASPSATHALSPRHSASPQAPLAPPRAPSAGPSSSAS